MADDLSLDQRAGHEGRRASRPMANKDLMAYYSHFGEITCKYKNSTHTPIISQLIKSHLHYNKARIKKKIYPLHFIPDKTFLTFQNKSYFFLPIYNLFSRGGRERGRIKLRHKSRSLGENFHVFFSSLL